MAKLTPKQERFVKEYLIDLNATQSAIRAGYTKSSAEKVSWIILQRPQVREAIDKANKKRLDKAEVSAEYVLRGLKENAELSKEMKDFNASNKSYELLGKHLKLFTDKIETENTNISLSYEDYLKKVNDSSEY